MDTMNGWGLIWDLEDVEDGGCVEDIKVIINHDVHLTNDDMSFCQARMFCPIPGKFEVSITGQVLQPGG